MPQLARIAQGRPTGPFSDNITKDTKPLLNKGCHRQKHYTAGGHHGRTHIVEDFSVVVNNGAQSDFRAEHESAEVIVNE